VRDKPTLARVLGVLNSEMAISESYGGEFSRSVEWWGERRERGCISVPARSRGLSESAGAGGAAVFAGT